MIISSDTADAGPSNGDGDQIAGNPIGVLQEQCMSRRWPPPTYETEMEVGLPHQRQFTIACVVLKLREIGQGKSKKIAKRLAAHKMWLRLLENPHEGSVTANQHIEELANGEEVSFCLWYLAKLAKILLWDGKLYISPYRLLLIDQTSICLIQRMHYTNQIKY